MYPWKKKMASVKSFVGSQTVVLAISGGVDSMALLAFWQNCFPSQFVVAHFDHGIRVDSGEPKLIEDWCQKHAIPFVLGHGVGLRNASNQEAKARDQRWAFLESVARERNISMVVTAHHRNDAIENFLVQAMRGMPVQSTMMAETTRCHDITRYKPFLDTEKNVLKASAQRFNMPWIEDETNTDTHHDRNFVRNVLLPQMENRGRNITKSLGSTIDSINEMLQSH